MENQEKIEIPVMDSENPDVYVATDGVDRQTVFID